MGHKTHKYSPISYLSINTRQSVTYPINTRQSVTFPINTHFMGCFRSVFNTSPTYSPRTYSPTDTKYPNPSPNRSIRKDWGWSVFNTSPTYSPRTYSPTDTKYPNPSPNRSIRKDWGWSVFK